MNTLLHSRPVATPYGNLRAGDRVEARPGVEGTVTFVQTSPVRVHVRWDNGSTLPMLPSLGDVIRKVGP